MKITSAQLVQLETLRRQFKLKLILLHGSQVTENSHAQSDIDVAILKLSNRPLNQINLITQLGSVLGSDQIDLADLTHADPLLLYQVTQNAQLLAGDSNDLTLLQLYALHRYIDYQPYFKLESKLVHQRLASYVTP